MPAPATATLEDASRNRTARLEVIHPLDDVPEQKVESENLGLILMTPTVRASLIALRAYLMVMGLLVLYRCLDLGGAFSAAK